MRIVVMFFILMFASSCDPPNIEKSLYLPSKQSLANYVRIQTAFHLEKEKGLVPCGTAGQMMDEIKMLGLSFRYYKEIGIDEACELLISSGASLLNTINSNTLIRPYLDKYPFEVNNVEIAIYLFKPNLTQFELDKLHYAMMVDGVLTYVFRCADTQYRVIHSETYQEALEQIDMPVSF
jgi:hypothetical protein